MSDPFQFLILRDNELAELRAEIERLKAENADLRRWKAMDKPITAAMSVVSNDMQRLKAQNTEVAAYLDTLAEHFFNTLGQRLLAADCRAMAAKLRGET